MIAIVGTLAVQPDILWEEKPGAALSGFSPASPVLLEALISEGNAVRGGISLAKASLSARRGSG